MKLRDYFISQKDISLDPAHKVELYENIASRTHARVSIFARMSFYTKIALYTFIGLVFIASLYVPYFSSFFQETDGILTANPGGATVQADYIAQIIETKGDIAIYNNGEKVESTLLRAGDKLVLPAGGEILFHVTNIAQAKLVGPAEFYIEQTDHGYTIQLIKGQYVEIQSLADAKEENNKSMGLRSSRVSIRPKQTKNMHFTYSEEGENAIIDNQWESELVVAKTDNVEQQEVLAQHSSAQLGTGTEILDDVTTGNKIDGQRLTPVQVAKALTDGQSEVKDSKKMISGEQHENIKAILAAEFLASDIQRITIDYLKGESRDYETAYLNFYNKIAQIYQIIDLPVPQQIIDSRMTMSLKVTISMIENLLNQIDNNYYVAQSHQSRLKKLLGRLYALREKEFGSEKGSQLSATDLLGTLNLDDYKDLLGK